MNAVLADGSGGVNVAKVPIPSPKLHERLIKVTAIGVNRADLLQIAGKYPPPVGTTDILGLEVAGRLEDGQEVCALLTGGAFAEYAVVPEATILKFPEEISRQLSSGQLAAIPEAFLAAFHVMFQIGKLTDNETVLINAAGSGVGTSAIQLASTLDNVTIIACAGSKEKLDVCKSLGAHCAVNYKEESISEVVAEYTEGRGVDLVIDCVGAAQFKPIERSLRMDGRWIIYGLLSGARSPDINLAGILSKRLTLSGTTMRGRSPDYRGSMVKSFLTKYGNKFGESGILRPIIHKEFNGLDSVAEAFEVVQENKNIGKVVVCLQ